VFRRGFTIIELLVVVAIVAVLAALTLAAVRRSREATRRAQCTNNLKQIGIALSVYHDVYRMFPHEGYTFLVAILPQMEQPALFDKVNYLFPGYSPQNLSVRSSLVPGYVCPSDESATFRDAGGGYGSNYAANTGSGVQAYGYNGVFSPWGMYRASDIRDGLSSTAAVAEILVANGQPDPPRLVLETPYDLTAPTQLDAFAVLCGSLGVSSGPFDAYSRGRPWNYGGWTWYNHVLTPGQNTCTNYTSS
jgi:prepilin-type N-terminal cleavage/methylation domain-containing protein